jgi:tripartite-type tricarboxylate transporter receptor subunit TctC
MHASVSRRASLGLLAQLCVLPVWSQGAVPLRMLLPVGPGSGVDAITRAAQPFLSKALGGQPVVVDNQPGAGGVTGTAQLAKAPPDGLTLGMVSNNHVINPSVFKNMPYDALADFTPISVLGATPFVLVVSPQKLAARNVPELVDWLKARPDVYNYASAGNGTVIHLAGEMFVDAAQVVVRHIPYKGTGPMVLGLLSGQVEMGVVALPAVQAHLQSGALRAIGLCGRQRTPAAPDIPTIAEQGLSQYEIEGWFAVLGPARLPAEQVQRLYGIFSSTFNSPEVREVMGRQGNVMHPTTPEVARTFLHTELTRYALLAQKAGIAIA